MIRFDFLPVLENPEQNGKIRMKTKKEIIRINIKSSHRQVFYKIQKKNTTNPSYFLFQYKNNKVEEVLGKDIYKFILKTFHNKETKG